MIAANRCHGSTCRGAHRDRVEPTDAVMPARRSDHAEHLDRARDSASRPERSSESWMRSAACRVRGRSGSARVRISKPMVVRSSTSAPEDSEHPSGIRDGGCAKEDGEGAVSDLAGSGEREARRATSSFTAT